MLKAISDETAVIGGASAFLKEISDNIEIGKMIEVEEDEESKTEFCQIVSQLLERFEAFEIQSTFTDKYDKKNAIVTIKPGAGGTESQDWASMLFRLYLRYVERRGYKAEIMEKIDGEEAGIKSVVINVIGDYSYGYLKGESGVHRLVRISPFDSNKKRHTSFVSVFVSPEIDDEIEININSDDLRIDTYRASGAGGQHINKTDSAVRITHLPTGIVASSQMERSQHKNKDTAMKMLKSKLYELEQERLAKESSEFTKDKKKIEWGSQIRSYILHPYNMVKDHRTDFETGNTEAVLDGKIDEFIKAYLIHNIQN